MLASVVSAMVFGVEGRLVHVEVHVSNGIPGYTVVGLPDAAVRESRERVRAALLSSGLDFPLRRVTVNLAPSGLRKSGAGLDLPFALGLMLAVGDLPAGVLDGVGVLGELGLDGSLRPVPGTLAMVDELRRAGIARVVLPVANGPEARLVAGVDVLTAASLTEIQACLKGERPWPEITDTPADGRGAASGAGSGCHPAVVGLRPLPACEADDPGVDLAHVRGLPGARRALEVAAAGGHHLLLVGPPGAGKTLLAHCLPSILPPLLPDEALEVTKIHSAAGRPVGGSLVRSRPFRAPHHSASGAALVGGGSGRPTPGEVTLAHRGALFLDELGEFSPTVLDALRQPLEERVVRISRQMGTVTFPADFVLVACSNPCPCGLGPPRCACNETLRARYRRRLSAPLVDRFDLRVAVGAAPPDLPPGASSTEVGARVGEAVARQLDRYRDAPWRRNARVPAGALASAILLRAEADDALRDAARRRDWSGRGMAGVRRVARTLADLDGEADVSVAHVIVAADLRDDVL